MSCAESGALEGPDDFELGEADEEEEEVQVFGGEGFTPQELAAAETEAIAKLVCSSALHDLC